MTQLTLTRRSLLAAAIGAAIAGPNLAQAEPARDLRNLAGLKTTDGQTVMPNGTTSADIGETQDGFKGHDVILFFGFTQCPKICPTALPKIKAAIEAQDGAKLVFVTVDHKNDTPEVIGEYLKAHGFTQDNAIGLTGSREKLQQVWDAFGAVMPTADHSAHSGHQGHTQMSQHNHVAGALIFDQDGAFLGVVDTQKPNVSEFKHAVASKLEGSAPPHQPSSQPMEHDHEMHHH